MHDKPPTYYELNTDQNIMASILQRLPQESAVTKIEYEGPYIALYSKNPSYLVRNCTFNFSHGKCDQKKNSS